MLALLAKIFGFFLFLNTTLGDNLKLYSFFIEMFAKVITTSFLLGTATAAVSRVDPTTAAGLVTEGKFDVIVDARSSSEFLRSRLPNAVQVSDVPDECLTKEITIGVYCYTGWDRSTPAAYYMDSQVIDGESKVWVRLEG